MPSQAAEHAVEKIAEDILERGVKFNDLDDAKEKWAGIIDKEIVKLIVQVVLGSSTKRK
jgi:hypothetical protein